MRHSGYHQINHLYNETAFQQSSILNLFDTDRGSSEQTLSTAQEL